MKHGKALIAGILASLASPATIAHTPRYHQLEGSDLQRIRGDVVRVGRTFNTVMTRERNKKAQQGS